MRSTTTAITRNVLSRFPTNVVTGMKSTVKIDSSLSGQIAREKDVRDVRIMKVSLYKLYRKIDYIYLKTNRTDYGNFSENSHNKEMTQQNIDHHQIMDSEDKPTH